MLFVIAFCVEVFDLDVNVIIDNIIIIEQRIIILRVLLKGALNLGLLLVEACTHRCAPILQHSDILLTENSHDILNHRLIVRQFGSQCFSDIILGNMTVLDRKQAQLFDNCITSDFIKHLFYVPTHPTVAPGDP